MSLAPASACGSHRKPCTRRPSSSSIAADAERRGDRAQGRRRPARSASPRPRPRSTRRPRRRAAGRAWAASCRAARTGDSAARCASPRRSRRRARPAARSAAGRAGARRRRRSAASSSLAGQAVASALGGAPEASLRGRRAERQVDVRLPARTEAGERRVVAARRDEGHAERQAAAGEAGRQRQRAPAEQVDEVGVARRAAR